MCALVALLLCATGSAWAQSDKSDVYTSNVTLSTTGGTNASTAKVIVTGTTEYDALKAGTSKNAGAVKITAPSGTKYLHLHIAGWNGESVTVTVKQGSTTVTSISLTADSGVSGSGTTYNLGSSSKATTDYYKVITFANALASNTDYTFTATSGKRFVIWGVNSEEVASKSPVGTFDEIDDVDDATKGGSFDFNPASYYTDDAGVTGTTTLSVTPTSGDIYYSEGKIYTTAYGSQEFTVTATPDEEDEDGFEEVTTSFTVTCPDTRTEVNMSSFKAASTTLVAGGSPSSTTTSVTNDQIGWTAAYTYSSSNTDVATVNASGVITAVAKGSATITCSLNVNPSDATYKAGTTTSKTVDITVNNPSHTATFSVNGDALLSSSDTFEEGATITFPSDPDDIDGKVFKGWVATPIAGTQVAAPSFVSSPEMGNSDVTYYAVFAEIVPGDEVTDTKTITTSTANIPTGYGSANTFTEYSLEGIKFKIQQMYLNGAKLQWRAAGNENGTGTMYNTDPLGKIQNIVLTYDSSDSNKNFTVKVGDSENPSSGTSITPTNVGSVYTFDCSSYNKSYFVLTNGSGAGYLSSIAITYKTGTPDTYTNYCTTVSDLPLAVVTLSTESITMTWGESGKTLTASATVNDEPLDETITFTPSSPNLTIDGSGNISCDVPGDYTITASVAETLAHQAGQAVCNVTVNKKDIELAFENETVNMMLSVGEYTQKATATPNAYDGDITYKITSSTSADAIIDEGTGELLFENTGIIVVTATAEEIALYNGNTATYTLYVKTTPDISVSDQNVAYGSTFTVDDRAITGGDITVSSSSETIATVDGLVITPVAVGSTIITVRTAATETYTAGEATFTMTVNVPEAASTNTAENTVFYESFNSISGTGGHDGTFSGNVGTSALTNSDESWNTTTRCGGAYQCLKFGTSDDATLTSNTISLSGNATLTFAGAGWNSGTMSLAVSATGATLAGDTNVTLTASTWKTYTIEITNATGSVTISFVGHRGFLDDIKITQAITSTTVTTTGGYATYCYQYPLDLDGISGAKAYKVSSLDKENEKVMLTEITGTIKGGVPFILKSDADTDDIEIPLADESTNVPDGNLLVGTLAPTFVEQTSGDYTNFAYSKSNKCFVKINESGNTVPANRAYLPINISGSSVKYITFDFGDADAISDVRSKMDDVRGEIFNLAGQKINRLQKGINIVNGKKVLVK